MSDKDTSAPLSGIRIVEFTGLGPGPFAGMMLADMGAEIIRIDRTGPSFNPAGKNPELDFLARGRSSIALDLKNPEAIEIALKLIESADGLIEGFRPGVMERLGLGPEICHQRNPRLVFGRMTGWGQTGPLSHAAGHDLNYIAITGALWASGPKDSAPTFPLNLLGDFGGGGMMLAFGMVSAFIKAQRTGQGDVVDAAICDGTTSLMAMIYSMRQMGLWQDKRQSNLLDGGAPWYGVYECSDGGWVSIGALEPQFWTCLLELLEIDEAEIGNRNDPTTWPAIGQKLTELFQSKPRDHWTDLLEGTDACFAPVLSPAEAIDYHHNKDRGVFSADGLDQPVPSPRFAKSATPVPAAAQIPGSSTREILTNAGFGESEIERLLADKVVKQTAS